MRRNRKMKYFAAAACWLMLVFVSGSSAQTLVSNMAVSSYIRPDYAPKYSDVLFTSRWIRGANYYDNVHHWGESYPIETIDVMKMYHADILTWLDCLDPDTNIPFAGFLAFVSEVSNMGVQVQPVLNFFYPTYEQAILDSSGNMIRDAVGRVTGCGNNTLYRTAFWNNWLKPLIDHGAVSLQLDLNNPPMNDPFQCFCAYCNGTKDGVTATTEFFTWLHQQADSYTGGKFAIHGNNLSYSLYSPTYFADIPDYRLDYGCSEADYRYISAQHFHNISLLARTYAGGNRAHVFASPTKVDTTKDNLWYRQLTRRCIANCYAQGMHMIAPFDTFHAYPANAGDEVQYNRYFGNPKYYADLYAFVKGIADYLDGYEFAWGWGRTPKAELHNQGSYGDTWGTLPGPNEPIVSVADGRAVVVRAIPSDANAPVAIHLVEWTGEEAFDIILNNASFFGRAKDDLVLTLLEPLDTYVQADHDAAWQTKQYTDFVKRTQLPHTYSNGQTTVTIPGLHPWAVLMVSNGNANPGDFHNDQRINFNDLALLSLDWGKTGSPYDLTDDDVIDVNDLSVLCGRWLKYYLLPGEGAAAGDLNKNYGINFDDLALMIANWQQTGSAYDLTDDNVVDVDDLKVMCDNWLKCNLLPASHPTPPDKHTDVSAAGIDLSWFGHNDVEYDIYLGTDANEVEQATRSSPAYQGTVTESNFVDPCTLAFETTYYWRVDPVSAAWQIPGNLWQFTTGPETISTDTIGYWELDTDGSATVGDFDMIISRGNPASDSTHYAIINNPDRSLPWNGEDDAATNTSSLVFNANSAMTCQALDDTFEFRKSRAFTCEGYVRPTGGSGSSNVIWGTRDGSSGWKGWYLLFNADTDRPLFYMDHSSGTTYFWGTANSMPKDVIKHVAVVWDPDGAADGRLKVYVDGSAVIDTKGLPQWDDLPGCGHNFMVGGRDHSTTWGFQGQIDEVRWSDKRLSPSEFLNAAP